MSSEEAREHPATAYEPAPPRARDCPGPAHVRSR
jgi:hypothetical protein